MLQFDSISTNTKAIISALTLGLIYVLLSLSSRLLDLGFENFTQVYLRISLGAMLTALLFHKKITYKKYLTLSKKDVAGIMLMGIIGYGLMVYFITKAVLLTSLVNTTVLFATVPFFVVGFSIILLRKIPALIQIFLVILSVWGVMMVGTDSLIPKVSEFGIGELFVLAAAAAEALYIIGRKFVSDRINNYELTLALMIIAAITTFILSIVSGESITLASFGIPLVVIGLILGAGLNIVAGLLGNFSFKHLDSVFASQLLLTESVFAFIIGYLFYKEMISVNELVGAVLILGSVYLANKYSSTA